MLSVPHLLQMGILRPWLHNLNSPNRDRYSRRLRNLEPLEERSMLAYTTLLNNGPSQNRVDIALVGDGYTSAEIATKYQADATNLMNRMFDQGEEPFATYEKFFNAYRIDVVSNESGADVPSEGIYRDTALDASYEFNGQSRLLYADNQKILAAIYGLGPAGVIPDIRVVSVNDTRYGGGGGLAAVYAAGSAAGALTALHEMGHSFGRLEDEYVTTLDAYTGPEPSSPNVTIDPTGAKWSHWIGYNQPGIGVIGVYEGADDYLTGIYRPSENSKMSDRNQPFDAVAREQLILQIYKQVDPLDGYLDNSTTITQGPLTVDVVDPAVIKVDWYVNNVLVAENHGESFDPALFGYATGNFTVTATAYDGTGWVRTRLNEVTESVTWNYAGGSPIVVTNTNDSGAGSLREAITLANQQPGVDAIQFNIPGSGPHTIAVQSPLPGVTGQTIIDGNSQPGYAGTPLIELSGANSTAGDGLILAGGKSVVRGLAINRFSGSGIKVSSNENRIVGAFLGTDVTGSQSLGNGQAGILIVDAANNVVGSPLAAPNVISGNGSSGIILTGPLTTANWIAGNRVGVNLAGTSALPNSEHGIALINQASDNQIGANGDGASDSAEGNLLSANLGNGVFIDGAATSDNRLVGNFIGTNSLGTLSLGNALSGVAITDAARNHIGDGAAEHANLIAFNALDGVAIGLGAGNTISANRIFANGEQGIDLASDGVTANDPGDADTGPNGRQNFPRVVSAISTGTTVQVQGSLESASNTSYRIEFFASPAGDPSLHGEGQIFLQGTTLTTNSAGVKSFLETLDGVVPAGYVITATATNLLTGDTSEFSQALAVSWPSLTIANESTFEYYSQASFAVTLGMPSSLPVTVTYSTADGTATVADNDYVATSGVLTFQPGQVVGYVSVDLISDGKFEADETFLLNLSNPSNAVIADGEGLGTIVNSSTQPKVSINGAAVTEGASGPSSMVATVTLSNPSYLPITAIYATADNTAQAADGDYQSASGTITFAPGVTSQSITLVASGDIKAEQNEDFVVNLSSPTNATLNGTSATFRIDNDDYAPQINVASSVFAEGNSGSFDAVIAITLSNPSSWPITVDYATSDEIATTADNDYQATSGTLNFAPGVTSQNITVRIFGDGVYEGSEGFYVRLTNPTNSYVGGNNWVVIQDDDGRPGLSIGNATISEGNSGVTVASLEVTLSHPADEAITLFYYPTEGSAKVADGDFQYEDTFLTFAPGVTKLFATIKVNGDLKYEPDETFSVKLAGNTNSTIVNGTGAVTIQNDDKQPGLTVTDATITEIDGNYVALALKVSVLDQDNQTITVNFATADGTATLADGDYQATSGVLTFQPGITSRQVIVRVNGDTKFEPEESFTLELSGATVAAIVKGSGVVTIQDNEVRPTLSIASRSVDEGTRDTNQLVLPVTLSNPSSERITVAYTTADDTARLADNDYYALSGTLTFQPGTTTQTITVEVRGDLRPETDECFSITLSDPVNAAVSNATAIGTITEDDFLWHWPIMPEDLSGDFRISAIDLIYLVDALNTFGATFLPNITPAPTLRYDISRDNYLSAIDLVLMVEALNSDPLYIPGVPFAAPQSAPPDVALHQAPLAATAVAGDTPAAEESAVRVGLAIFDSAAASTEQAFAPVDSSSTSASCQPRALEFPISSVFEARFSKAEATGRPSEKATARILAYVVDQLLDATESIL